MLNDENFRGRVTADKRGHNWDPNLRRYLQ
jgi:hypothetical protein